MNEKIEKLRKEYDIKKTINEESIEYEFPSRRYGKIGKRIEIFDSRIVLISEELDRKRMKLY